MIACCLMATVTTYAQLDEIEWSTTKHTYYTDISFIPGNNGLFAVEGNMEGGGSEVTLYNPQDFKKSKTHQLLSTKRKENIYRNGQASTGATSIGGEIYSYEKRYSETRMRSSVVLTCLSSDKPDITINELPDPKGKDVMINYNAVSPNRKYTVVYSTSVLGKNFKDRMQRIPYLGYAFLYFGKRKADFYERVNVFSVFDQRGKKVWTKEFMLNGSDTVNYVQDVKISDEGKVFIHTRATHLKSNTFLNGSHFNLIAKSRGYYSERIYSIGRNDDTPVRLDYHVKDSKNFAFEASYERFFFSGNDYLRVANVEIGHRAKGILYRSFTAKRFVGFIINNLSDPQVPTVLIQISANDLLKSFSKKETKKLSKGGTITVGVPEVAGVHLHKSKGIYLFIEHGYHPTAAADMNKAYDNLVILNTDYKGKVNWSEVKPNRGGGFGIHCIVEGESFLLVENSAKRAENKRRAEPVIWIQRLDWEARILEEFWLKTDKVNVHLDETLVNGNGDIMLYGKKSRAVDYRGALKSEKTYVGRVNVD